MSDTNDQSQADNTAEEAGPTKYSDKVKKNKDVLEFHLFAIEVIAIALGAIFAVVQLTNHSETLEQQRLFHEEQIQIERKYKTDEKMQEKVNEVLDYIKNDFPTDKGVIQKLYDNHKGKHNGRFYDNITFEVFHYANHVIKKINVFPAGYAVLISAFVIKR